VAVTLPARIWWFTYDTRLEHRCIVAPARNAYRVSLLRHFLRRRRADSQEWKL
jgi:hypothetical protein